MIRLALYIFAAYAIAMAAVAVIAIPSTVMSWIRTTTSHSGNQRTNADRLH